MKEPTMRRFRTLAAWLVCGSGSVLGVTSVSGQESSSNASQFVVPGRAGGTSGPQTAPGSIVACPPSPTVIHYSPRVTLLPTPFGFVPYAPPIIVSSGAAGPWVATPPFLPPSGILPGPYGPPFGYPMEPMFGLPPQLPMMPDPPRQLQANQAAQPQQARARPVRRAANRDRSTELLTIGDRNFRAGDHRRAEQRYEQALDRFPFSAAPRLRMAQVAILREDYRAAADWLREATTAEATWLDRPENVQAIFAEPADFHDALATLEAHLQATPEDRDAWLVLGTELLLSDRADRAADIFLRLADRPPDPTLAALMLASGLDR